MVGDIVVTWSKMNNLHLNFVNSSKIINLTASFIYDHEKPWWKQILDPNGEFVNKWNRVFLVTSLTALFLDPLFFYIPRMEEKCMEINTTLAIIIIIMRSIVDFFSFLHISMKFRTAFVEPCSRVFGKGDLVCDPTKIAYRYLRSELIVDALAALPIPQFIVVVLMPISKLHGAVLANHYINLVIIVQFIPRLCVIFPLNSKIIKNTGVAAKTEWSGAAYNLLLFLLVSHVLGAAWYLMSFERHITCWKDVCANENKGRNPCEPNYLDCQYTSAEANRWQNVTKVFTTCVPGNYEFGMFIDAFRDQVTSADFVSTYFYCLWWGLRNLSSYGQNLTASTQVMELIFCSVICLVGLVFFALLIGNMQTYMSSMTARLEEWRLKRRDTEEWMAHRQLPLELQDRVRRFVQYKWIATRGVDEKEILQSLPLDLRRQIQSHLCLALVRRVPFFSQMDDQLLDAICERLVSSLNTKETYIVREGDPVNEMIFIIRGELESSTTDGGRTGFFNSTTLKSGDFCGEELLTWALMPSSDLNLPSSTRTVKSLTEVDAFALRAEDLKFVASQFKRLHSKKLQHAFRYYSHQWRAWGACFIQAAWRRHKRRKLAMELAKQESQVYYSLAVQDGEAGGSGTGMDNMNNNNNNNNAQNLGVTILASKFAANTRKGAAHNKAVTVIDPDHPSLRMPKLFKPNEPDFSEYKEQDTQYTDEWEV